MSEFQKMVLEFDKGIGADRNLENTPMFITKDLRISLIEEEAEETFEAIKRRDLPEVLDGACDLLYVIYGAGNIFGIKLQESEIRIDAAMRQKEFGSWADFDEQEEEFKEAVELLVSSIRSENAEKFAERANDLIQGLWMMCADGLGIDLRPFFREVHRTNMHKLTGPKREDGKQLKPPDWSPPRIKEMLVELGFKEYA